MLSHKAFNEMQNSFGECAKFAFSRKGRSEMKVKVVEIHTRVIYIQISHFGQMEEPFFLI